MRNIIGIAGLRNSGKDTVANMLQYCLSVPKFMQLYWLYNILGQLTISNWNITSFASTLKEALSVLINVSVDQFDEREFKENYYINLKTIHITSLPPKNKKITDKNLNKLIKSNDLKSISDYYITIRQLLQIFGTEIIRVYFGDNFWIYRTLLHDQNLIVSDLRFINEYNKIKDLEGTTVYINRNQTPGVHRSESEVMSLYKDNKFDYVIDNTGDLRDLFYKVSEYTNIVKHNQLKDKK